MQYINAQIQKLETRSAGWAKKAADYLANSASKAEAHVAGWRRKATAFWEDKANEYVRQAGERANAQAAIWNARAKELADQIPPLREIQAEATRRLEASRASNAQYLAFKELVIEMLREYFSSAPEATEWRGTVSRLIQQLHANDKNEPVMRMLRLENVSKFLERMQGESAPACFKETIIVPNNWVFLRLPSIFDKP